MLLPHVFPCLGLYFPNAVALLESNGYVVCWRVSMTIDFEYNEILLCLLKSIEPHCCSHTPTHRIC